MSDIPKFRRVEDLIRFVDSMNQEVDELSQVVDQQQKLMARLTRPTPKLKTIMAAIEFDITPRNRRSNVSQMNRAIDPSLAKVVIPGLDKLKDQYGLLDELHTKHAVADSLITQLEMQFGDRKGPAFEKAMAGVMEMKDKIEQRMRKVLEFLNSVAQKHVPAVFQEYVNAVSEKIEEHVYSEDAQRFLYVHVQDAKSIVFTEYVLLTDSVNDSGQIAPQLYIVIQWVVGGEVTVFVEHEFTPPARLTEGTVVPSVQAAANAISHDLTLEGFASYMGTVPMALHLKMAPEFLKPGMFKSSNYIDKISVDKDQLLFHFRSAMIAPEVKKQIGYALFPEVKALMKNKSVKLRMKPERTCIKFFVTSPAKESAASVLDLEYMKTKFNLSDGAVAKIGRIINDR